MLTGLSWFLIWLPHCHSSSCCDSTWQALPTYHLTVMSRGGDIKIKLLFVLLPWINWSDSFQICIWMYTILTDRIKVISIFYYLLIQSNEWFSQYVSKKLNICHLHTTFFQYILPYSNSCDISYKLKGLLIFKKLKLSIFSCCLW